MLHSIHSDDGNLTSANIKQALRQINIKMEMEIPGFRRVKFKAACSYSNDKYKDMMKAQVHVTKDFRYSDT
ncbi:hypothetical protein Tco_1122073 [Tanacetum coccineum]|uniref:Uncharacterized protein n=1 Tax=Tanacetum coccineum TaxID=301880 RepID=A0ABQ5J2H1_9ASTR